MSRWTAGITPARIAVLVAVAVVGCLVGLRGAPSAVPSPGAAHTRLLFSGDLGFEYPSTWRRTADPAPLAGLHFSEAVQLTPGGRAGIAGLIAGQLSGTESSPLPGEFVSHLDRPARTEIVVQPYLQAFRYRAIEPNAQSVELYVAPVQGHDAKAVACYAKSANSSYLRQCEQIVAHVTLSAPLQDNLAPNAGYARSLAAAVEPVMGERRRLRAAMRAAQSPASRGRFATSLSDQFAVAARTVAQLQTPSEAPAAVASAQSALSSGLGAVANAYGALGRADGSSVAQVEHAETEVDAALTSFAFLGYGA